ncbi:MAG: 5'/3'-nucleotidase SurE [Clostridia bacterium]|nr:5'/3'-nucleotidase SurE [Clostridia bacterium]
MHILISNDDGIFAPGIKALAKAAVDAGHKVTIFAPDTQRSAASHSISLSRPLKVLAVDYDWDIPAYSVDGSPADCVRVGVYLCREKGEPADLVLSGVNKGANRGAAILYSGTVSAAMEGSLCGVPGVAVSLCHYTSEEFALSAALGVKTAEWAVHHPLPRGEIYNLNVPCREEILGIRAASVSHEFIGDPLYTLLEDGSYIVANTPDVLPAKEDGDMELTRAGYATLSVLTWNLQAATPVPDISGLEG